MATAPDHDPPPIERLLAENLTGLRAFLRVRTGAAIRARLEHSDLVQSVCREVLEGADHFEFRGDAAFRNWLYTAALRKIVEQHRKQHAACRDVRRELAVDADGGADAAVLQGYEEKPPAGFSLPEGSYYNNYFPGHAIKMPKPLSDGQVTYGDGSPTTVAQYSKDVTTFLMWTAEPHMEARKRLGLQVFVFLILLTGLLYFTKKKIWADAH